jgi:hypothetical protein
MRDFAVATGLRFRGTLPSDKYDPYRRFPGVERSVLLYNAMEGASDGFETALFDYYASRGTTSTGVIVSLPTDDSTSFTAMPGAPPLGLGSRTTSQLVLDPSVSVATNLGYLFVRAPGKLDGDRLRDFLAFAAALARAIEADHRAAQ